MSEVLGRNKMKFFAWIWEKLGAPSGEISIGELMVEWDQIQEKCLRMEIIGMKTDRQHVKKQMERRLFSALKEEVLTGSRKSEGY